MFEYVKLKNFKSFKDVEFNMLDRRNKPKKLVLIYGENGIGKSNLASAFFMLSETFRTMDVRDLMEAILSDDKADIKDNEHFREFLKLNYKDIETLIKENKTVASEEPMYLEFGFNVKGKKGVYILETNNSQIIHEKLEYTLVKNKGVYYDITPDKNSISEKIFIENTAYQTIKESSSKFWGKHTLLSIILHEIDDKSDKYFKNQLSENFHLVLKFLNDMSCKIKFGSSKERGCLGLSTNSLPYYDAGVTSKKNEIALDKSERMLNAFFKVAYRDINKVYYKRTVDGENINYNLMLQKNIAGENREIDFALESTGTQSIIAQLPFMLVAVHGSTSIIDEFDTGIHDLLVKALVTSLYEDIEGQLIMTTHNTLLMEAAIPKDSIYVINELDSGNKEIKCILHYNNKIGENNNIRNQYLVGKYKGIPNEAKINFKALLECLES